jgi:hypothetical protein
VDSYETQHRIHDIAIYPFTSSNGSTLIIYGHDNGVRLIWRGGRPFKPQSPLEEKSKTNGANADDVMIIDSDDERPGSHAPSFEDKPEFADGDDEIDPSKPYPRTIQHLDLNFGAAALHIAVPTASAFAGDASSGFSPAILNDQLVFVIACSDQKLRIVTRPLTPPSPLSKSRQDIRSAITAGYAGHGKWGETVQELVASVLPADGVSVTFTNAEKASIPNGDRQLRNTRLSSTSGPEWQMLVASFSREGPGLLLIHRIPIVATQKQGKTGYSLSRNHSGPSQRITLSSPATSITFNPNMSSPLLSTHLLVADKSGACRVYDCEPSHASSSISSENLGSTPSASQNGSWLLTMYPGFVSSKTDASNVASATSYGNFGRKVVVDAKWVMGGKAVIVLLADGEWGVWDIGGDGSASGSKGILGQHRIKGGAMTAFSISGWIDSVPVKSSSIKGAAARTSNSKFAPMTPSTRKTAEPVLFSGRSSHGFARGKISVVRLQSTSTITFAEESIAFWLEDSYCVIPNLRAYWDAQSHRNGGGPGNLFGGGNSTSRMIRLEGVNLCGERCCGIDQHPQYSNSKSLLPAEILILGEHRYSIASDNTYQLRGQKRKAPSHGEFQVTAARDLDVTEIDQVLSRMEKGNSSTTTKMKRTVGFLD